MKNERKIGRILFTIILVLHVIGCYVMGIAIIADTETAMITGFGVNYADDLEIVGLVIGMELLFLGTMALLGILWTRKQKLTGIYIGSAVGVYMFLFGIVACIKFGTTDALIVDSIRGFLTIVFGYMVYKELKASLANG
ncbi:MAG: hypothetical protein P8P74_08945 [Crocinitomicaceae bacterium]|nr:hypothetical protein [Crocinitomicaceae bacterium]